MSILKSFLLFGKNFFFPSACAVCKTGLLNAREIRYSLCDLCRISIVPVQGDKCLICGKPLISEAGTCLPCRNSLQRSYDRLWVLFPYTGKFRKLLTSYKFAKNLTLADFFAEKLIEAIFNESLPQDFAIVPVPPRPGKIKETGWDQVDYLVKHMEKKLKCLPQAGEGKFVCRCLKRRKSTAQKQLNRAERQENLKGRIFFNGAAVPSTALIIDDVITTGSTIEICAQVLKQAGAKKVFAICLFYD